ncbi:hypothetical protein RINTHH_11990 [Richelia intracellularis HH01]|uniref:Uncharacterized protein n=1 Tax=Richelia intracellularis HH01 TaxID=1165094 RepID=M1WSB5_9NOST|nr:hypothetical protein RINTHH_11990 [Richelia intracellularis HH01]
MTYLPKRKINFLLINLWKYLESPGLQQKYAEHLKITGK